MRENVLVTGGAGFIGSHIVDALLDAGHRVCVVDDLSTGKLANLNLAARLYRLDICDGAALERVFAAERPSVVFHQAAKADVRASLTDPLGYAMVNVIGSLNLLEAARRYGVRKFIFASSGGAVYGEPATLPVTESHSAHPLDAYGASKLAIEHYLYLYYHNFALDYCALRYANVYGPRQDPKGEAGVVAIFAGRMLRRAETVINGDGRQTRDFVYVSDIARANLMAMERGHGIYNLGSTRGADVNTIFRQLARLTGYRLPEVHGPSKQGEVRSIYLDAGLARAELGWEPKVRLPEGLAYTLQHLQLVSDRPERPDYALGVPAADDSPRTRPGTGAGVSHPATAPLDPGWEPGASSARA